MDTKRNTERATQIKHSRRLCGTGTFRAGDGESWRQGLECGDGGVPRRARGRGRR